MIDYDNPKTRSVRVDTLHKGDVLLIENDLPARVESAVLFSVLGVVRMRVRYAWEPTMRPFPLEPYRRETLVQKVAE